MASRTDLPYCAELLPAGFQVSSRVRQRLVELWGRLLSSDARTFTVVEDLERPRPQNIEGFGLSVFVSDRFADEFRASPRPYLSSLVYEGMLDADDVVLTPEQLSAAHNGAGLNLITLHFGLRNEDLADPRSAQVLAAGSAGFYFFHSGYRIKLILNEVYGAQAARFMELGGFRMVHDFQRESPERFQGLPPEHYPYLFMLQREWVQPGAIHLISQLFSPSTPRLYFTAAERRVLECALLNESDSQIAERLGISLDSVKKTWRNIYDRASRGLPNLMPQDEGMLTGGRGQEKRRHLLDYLRTHLEELRPGRPLSRQ
jgi:DNA-binding CsgD family transcriptional regulator